MKVAAAWSVRRVAIGQLADRAKPGFAEKAPPEVVAKERARLAEREERVRLLEAETKKRRA